jgi:hypothetical protein
MEGTQAHPRHCASTLLKDRQKLLKEAKGLA